MAGALTERDFVAKLEKAGFDGITIHAREPLGLDDLALYPLFTPDLLDLMRSLIAPNRRNEVGVAIVVGARRARGDRLSGRGSPARPSK